MDTLCWSVPTLIWAFSKNFTWFLMGNLFNGVNSIVSASFNCMFVEGTAPNKRVFAYSIFSTLGITAGFFTPLGGLLVNKVGMIAGGRIIYLISFVSITAMILIRHFLMVETDVGLTKMKETKGHSFTETLKDYLEAVRHICSNPAAIVSLLLFGVYMIQTNMLNSVCHPLFLTDYLGYTKAQYGIFPMISSVVTIAVLMASLHLMQGREKRGLALGMLILAVGWLVMGLLTRGNTAMVVLSTALVAAGWAFFNPGLNTVWSNALTDEMRAKSQSLKDVFAAFVTIPAGYIGAKLYALDPRAPYLLMAGLFIMGTMLYVWTIRYIKRKHNVYIDQLPKAS
jgi:MFS family permease